jgi:uncharacterized repeat protein (TIGR04076 family)
MENIYDEKMPAYDVKITVLKKVKTGEILEEYTAPSMETECPAMKEGVAYISKGVKMPDGFCHWAWSDIQRDVAVLTFGGEFPSVKKKGTKISCCTDGLQPVIFKLERV